MAFLLNMRPKNRIGPYWLVVILLVNLTLATGATWYSNIESTSRPMNIHPAREHKPPPPTPCGVTELQGCDREVFTTVPLPCSFTGQLSCSDRQPTISQQQSKSGSPTAQATNLTPFLNIIPSQDGTELFVSASGVGDLGGTAFLNIGDGPGHDRGGWTMPYSDTVQAHVATATGFTPNTGASGPLSITTTLGVDTGAVDFNRAYVPASTTQSISSLDGNLQLSLVTTDTINFNTYVAVVPSFGPPGPAPQGHYFIGSTYSVRAAGALTGTNKPMSLRLYYSDATLAGADPHTLGIFSWDAFNKQWDYLGGRLFYDQKYLSVITDRFTTYALMAIPAWRDEFDDFNGLNFPAEVNNVTLGGTVENRTLVLLASPGSGTAVSKPITPTGTLANWGTLTYSSTVDPPTTTLTVDVLSLDGTEVLTDVASGTSLASLDPAQYSSLKLRLNLSSTTGGETASLEQWQLTWQVTEERIYLPVVLK